MRTTSVVAVTAPQTSGREPLNVQKRIGSTFYIVSIHFAKTCEETIKEKLIRLVESEATQNA